MWQHLKTIILVTLVTAIIWVFAESESLRVVQVPGVEMTVAAPPGSKYVVDLTPDQGVHGNGVRADLVIEGPTAAVDAAERLLRNPIILNPGMPGFAIEPGRHTVDLQAVLRDHPDLHLSARGVSIKSVTPESVVATVEE